ncbi:MAG TPA: 50S ribosomal protein L4 [Gemmatimonadales bacterium]|jgi:large subunit ribosomal protein L4
MIEAPHYSTTGARHPQAFALPDNPFDGAVNEDVLHLAVKVYLANQRQGTAKTKTRSFVTGGNQKPWKQKGTGRARSGSSRSPVWVGGGTVFGPIPRDYRAALPRKVRQLARRSALNARAREGMLHIVDTFTMSAPKTSTLLALLEKLSLGATKTLILTSGANNVVYLSARNVQRLEVMPFRDATAYDILRADALVIERAAFDGATDADDETVDAAAAAPRARKAAPKKAAARKTAAKKAPAAKTTAKKAATKKSPAKKASE